MRFTQRAAGNRQRLRGHDGVAIGCDLLQHALVPLRFERQLDMARGDVGLRRVAGRHQLRILVRDYLFGHAIVVEIHVELIGRVAQLAMRRFLAAVGFERCQLADYVILQLDHSVVTFHHGVRAGDAAPRLEPDLAGALVVAEGRRLDQGGLTPGFAGFQCTSTSCFICSSCTAGS